MAFALCDTTTTAAIIDETTNLGQRQALKDALGTGTLTVTAFNPDNSQNITGTFSGALIGTGNNMFDNIQIVSPSGTGGTPDSTWVLKIENGAGRFMSVVKELWTYVGPNGSAAIDVADDLYFSVTIIDSISTPVVPPGDPSVIFGSYVTADPGYTPTTPPNTIVRTLMDPSDTPFKLGKIFSGWHRDNLYSINPYEVLHQRLHDWRPASDADDGGVFWARVARAGRHQYDWARFDEAIQSNGGCPKIVLTYLTPAWAVSEANKTEIRRRYGPENQFGQIQNVTRYPSYPYSGHPPEDWTYLSEYIEAIFRPKDQTGPVGEPGGGYTAEQIPVIELDNEQKFSSKGINAGRWWDNPFVNQTVDQSSNYYPGKIGPRAFNLMTMQEMAIKARIAKASVPAGVQVWCGGWEGDSSGRSAANPGAGYSTMQAWMLTDDGAGGIAADHVDCIPFHPYMYNYDPIRVQQEIDGYRAQLQWLAQLTGKPSLATLPIHANETGHESTNGQDNFYGTGSWLIDNNAANVGNQQLGNDILVTNIIAAGNASRQGCIGLTSYKDIPYAGANGKSNGRQTYGAVTETPTIYQKQISVNTLDQKVVRQAYQLSDRWWLECEDGTILQSIP